MLCILFTFILFLPLNRLRDKILERGGKCMDLMLLLDRIASDHSILLGLAHITDLIVTADKNT